MDLSLEKIKEEKKNLELLLQNQKIEVEKSQDIIKNSLERIDFLTKEEAKLEKNLYEQTLKEMKEKFPMFDFEKFNNEAKHYTTEIKTKMLKTWLLLDEKIKFGDAKEYIKSNLNYLEKTDFVNKVKKIINGR